MSVNPLVGVRVLLNITYGTETRDLNIYVSGELSSTIKQERTVTQQRAEWRGLSQTGATAKTATTGWTIVSKDKSGSSGFWTVTEEKLTYGAWGAAS